MTQAGDQTNHPQILSVVGVGGLGKTTLAQVVYNDSRVRECFELRIWICVSDPFDEVTVAKNIIENVKGTSPDSNQLGFLLQRLKECISGKKFLLVMDDVWTEDPSKWEPLITCLKNGNIGSKVLVTTRKVGVAKMMGSMENGIHHLGLLSDENCWFLLQSIALFGRDESEWEKFEGIGRNISNKCKGLPLAAKVLGSLLRLKNSLEEWEDVYNSEIWELEGPKDNIFRHLHLSYNELSPSLKLCFSYCAVFPKDTRIKVEELIGHWMALGYLGGTGDMELRGQKYFDNLSMPSLFQDFEKNYLNGKIRICKMHDIVHDFALSLRKNRIKKTSKCETCSPLLVSRAKEYRSIYFDNKEARWPRCSCVTNLKVVSVKREFDQRHEIERFIHLRWLDMSHNELAAKDLETICRLYNLQTLLLNHCKLKEMTREIGNLIHLRHLNLSGNESLKELPERICDLHELQRLNIDDCMGIHRLPQGFHKLKNLKHFHNAHNTSMMQFPQGVAQLTGLRTLAELHVGCGVGKLGWLKNLNRLSGSLRLIVDSENIVEDAREGELMKKNCIQELVIEFKGRPFRKEDLKSVSLLDALEPHPNLVKLKINDYGGSKLPSWMVSPLNQLKFIHLYDFSRLSSLPPLGRLPCLEQILICNFEKLEVVGSEFLGTTTDGSSNSHSRGSIAFPKLKGLTFSGCVNWREWEDITTTQEEEAADSAASSVMPCLKELKISGCNSLTTLPHWLLLRVFSPSLKLDVSG